MGRVSYIVGTGAGCGGGPLAGVRPSLRVDGWTLDMPQGVRRPQFT